MNAPDKAVAFEALMKDTPGFDHYDSGYDGILMKYLLYLASKYLKTLKCHG